MRYDRIVITGRAGETLGEWDHGHAMCPWTVVILPRRTFAQRERESPRFEPNQDSVMEFDCEIGQ